MKHLTIKQPWPGPRPYDETEWPIFFGRKREVVEAEKLFLGQRLTVLAGPSGVGKTSLLRAGLVPRLRLKRYRDRSAAAWPILVMRDWGEFGQLKFNQLIREQIKKSIDGILYWQNEGPGPQEDCDHLKAAYQKTSRSSSLIELFQRLSTCDPTTNGIGLIFDQVEEILRRGKQSAQETIELLRQIYVSGLPIRVLVSLRQEHLSDLRDLERLVGGLMNQTYFLDGMDEHATKSAIKSAAAAFDVALSSNVTSLILKWVRPADRQSEYKEGDLDAGTSVNLLALQAVLAEFFTECIEKKAIGNGKIEILEQDLSRFSKRQFGSQDGKYEKVASKALERWIERAIGGEGTETDLARRVAIRMAPHLSAGGFKVSQEGNSLLRRSLGEDLRVLTQAGPEQTRRIRIHPKTAQLDVDGLGMSAGTSATKRLSGVALASGLNIVETAQLLFSAYRDALERLRSGNLIKRFSDDLGNERWELVHDGLGSSFADWADDRRDDWRDCSSSLVACRGITPIMIKKEDLRNLNGSFVRHMRWEGCLISPAKSRLVLEGMIFENCKLRGSVFNRLTFRNCCFRHCELHGTIFKDCVFSADAEGRESSFEMCSPESMAILNSRIDALGFEECELSQLTFLSIDLYGQVRFRNSKVSLGSFRKLTSKQNASALVFEEDCLVSYSSGDSESWEKIDFRCQRIKCKDMENGA